MLSFVAQFCMLRKFSARKNSPRWNFPGRVSEGANFLGEHAQPQSFAFVLNDNAFSLNIFGVIQKQSVYKHQLAVFLHSK